MVMNFTYRVTGQEKDRYLEITAAEEPLKTERQTLDLISLCFENSIELLMLHDKALSGDFFQLATGVAGGILQKLINYHIKTAIVLSEDITLPKRFQEMLQEANKGEQYRFFYAGSGAEQWLLSGQME